MSPKLVVMKFEKLNELLKNPYIGWLLLAFLVYLALPVYLPSTSFLCESENPNINTCLDASWVTSLHWAIQKNLVFGKEYLFTYGPLGFLGTRTALGFSHLYLVISDLFILANLAFILFYAIRKFNNFQAVIFCLLIIYTMSGGIGMYADQIVFTLMLISIFWLNYSLEHSKTISLIIPVIITALLFYIKVNISFVSLVLFYLYLIYFIFSDKENRKAKVIFGLSVPLLIFLLSFPLNTDIFGYILGGLSLVDGYNDAMSIKLGEFGKYLGIALLAVLVFLVTFFIKIEKVKQNILLLFAFGIFTFVLYKQSFVRSDLHVAIFFTFFPAICGLMVLFYKDLKFSQVITAFCLCLVCLISELTLISYPSFGDRLNYFTAVFYPNNIEERTAKNYERFSLPAEVREAIGNRGVDIIPWAVNYLYFNNLNYNPRPIIQSYSAYTPYLINLNKQKYEGEAAPDFVLFSHTSIDWRYPLFDDQEAKLSLIRNYNCLGLHKTQGSDFLLFQRSPNKNALNFTNPIEETIKFGENYFLKDTNKSYFIKIDADYSLLGKAVRFAYKPFPITIVFTLGDGSERPFRAIVPIIKNGVLINPLIDEPKDFQDFVNGNSIAENKKIKAFRIELESPSRSVKLIAPYTYVSEIKLSVSEFSINRNN